MNITDLTVNERILLHLRNYLTQDIQTSAVMGQTQGGISEGIDIRINHIPRAVKKLLDDNYVEECLAHVGGLKRKRKVYILTESGMKKSNDMLDSLKEVEVLVKFEDGKEELIKIMDIPLSFNTNATLSEIILSAFSHGEVYESKLCIGADSALPLISNLDTILDIPTFYGRKDIIERLRSNIDGERTISVIGGIKGIGKTSLVRRTLADYDNKRNILWHTAHEWDTLRSFLESMADLLGQSDKGDVRRILRSSRDMDPALAFTPLANDLHGLECIMVIDNIFNLQKELMHLILMILKDVGKFSNTHFILITRDVKFLKRDLIPQPTIDFITLDGLTLKEARKMMDMKEIELEISDEDLDIIYGITNGHPLAIKLITLEFNEVSFDTKGLTREEFLMVKSLKAFDSIFQ
ncbi:MAG: hypothetical protein KAS16_02700 [Thermoplasmata archaeon]|nr:hypothetical protein [Thermoplasmata archaeon]